MCLPESENHKIAQAYMGSHDSGYAHLYWDARQIQTTPMDAVRVDRYVLQRGTNMWYVAQPKPKKGASGQVISICCENLKLTGMSTN